jgi:SAM-dependent methyltransferase
MPADHAIRPAACVVCGCAMRARLAADVWRCPQCNYWCSTFTAAGSRPPIALDEVRRQAALAAVRSRNAREIFRVLGAYGPLRGARLCDVGCGYGWFLETAQSLGMDALGIEPDAAVAQQAIAGGLNVRVGSFPQCLAAGELFDLVTFNDVLEHLPQVPQVLAACHAHLAPGGILAIAIPSSGGAIFRAGSLLKRFGVSRPFDRLWQRNYPCPHVHYFDRRNLPALLARHGFGLLHSQSLPAFGLKGLWSRLQMDRSSSSATGAVAWAALAAARPLLGLLPADILLQVYRATGSRSAHRAPSSERPAAAPAENLEYEACRSR